MIRSGWGVRGLLSMADEKRILVVTPWFPSSPEDGRYNFVFHSVDALRLKGNRVATLVTTPWTPRFFGLLNTEWRRPSIKLERFDSGLGLESIRYFSLPRNFCHYAVWELYRRTIAGQIERMANTVGSQVIHVHTECAAFAAVPVAKKLGIPIVITLHGINLAKRQLDTHKKRARLRHALSGADKVILVGEPLRTHFSALAGGNENFCVVPNGFVLPCGSNPSRRVLNDPKLRLISISNLHEGKGIDLNLEALALLDRRGINNWCYTIVGDGAERPRLETMVDSMGLRNRVAFCGHLPHREALGKLADADVFLLPSYREAFGVAYLEAIASGLLAIGVEGQGPEAFIQQGETGYLVPPRDAGAIAELLGFVIRNRDECRRVARQGCDLVRQEFPWDRHAEKLMTVYDEVRKNRCK